MYRSFFPQGGRNKGPAGIRLLALYISPIVRLRVQLHFYTFLVAPAEVKDAKDF